MRGSLAKKIRREARERAQAAGYPDKEYQEKVVKTVLQEDPVTGKRIPVQKKLVTLVADCERSVYKLLKRLMKEHRNNGNRLDQAQV